MHHFLIAEFSQMSFLIIFVLLFGAFAAILNHVPRIFLWVKNADKTPYSLGLLVRFKDQKLRDLASRWLSRKLFDPDLCVERAILFGSVVHDHFPTSDVDVLILMKPVAYRKAVKSGRKIKTEVRRNFKQTFDHQLHFQFFVYDEKDRFDKFLARLGRWEELRLQVSQ